MYRQKHTVDQVRALIRYDPDTGEFTWLTRKQRHNLDPDEAGSEGRWGKDVKRHICIDYTIYYASRLAWLLMTGEWPDGIVIHLNNDQLDYRWDNLACVSRAEHNRIKYRERQRGVDGRFA